MDVISHFRIKKGKKGSAPKSEREGKQPYCPNQFKGKENKTTEEEDNRAGKSVFGIDAE